MKYRVTEKGYINQRIYQPGEEFETDKELKEASWFEAVKPRGRRPKKDADDQPQAEG